PARSAHGNQHLGRLLAFTAGARNAGGFLIVKQYTSHMSGMVSSVADDLVIGQFDLALLACSAVAAFTSGAIMSSVLINIGRQADARSLYALPLLVEATLVAAFGVLTADLARGPVMGDATLVSLLCFVMGCQNAIITKISKAEIRTTHVTGLITDIGIELGRWLYFSASRNGHHPSAVPEDRAKLVLLSSLLGAFVLGALLGAIGFKLVGGLAALLPASMLALAAVVPMADDLGWYLRRK
ncbi:MAG: YoaK family protein, partial [Sphingomonadaceae bacterium]